ncbi:alpha/beta fold hydrolase [Trichlorobacter lovleyi]|uniref:alpha/beta fold hydrolase n=1 Tax=Trichlorobacter lovleyi TaxID=313985 RepID=UPI00223E9A2D|nr:alpha/beta fold hydrolase [Trichlorobacter lovleyi]QOX78148.1 alpha/beta fold hydrolase [Trichlorobacter lovleyi]
MIAKNAFINGNMIAYDDVGTGPAVMLIHGFPLNRSMWRSQLGDLVAAGYRVITPDLRGFGESDAPDGTYSMDLFSDDLISLLDHLEIEQAVAAGMSMGGYVLFNLLARYPERISGAVFVVTRSVADDEAGRARRLQLATELLRFGPQVVADSFHPLMFAPGTVEARPKLAEEVYGWMVANPSRGLAGGLIAMRERPDVTPLLQSITTPSLVIAAEQDKACPLEHPRMIANNISGSRLEVIADAGHLVNLEQPNGFNHCLLEFLCKVAPTALNDGTIGCHC